MTDHALVLRDHIAAFDGMVRILETDQDLNRIQFESDGLGPCLDARRTHMAALPEGGSVKTGVTR